ncbi:MAG: hypothetical protein K5697_00965 [Lachnospiraceae bacterium]|nr:hypothetical protein [Lachnospiraceae bacterium]
MTLIIMSDPDDLSFVVDVKKAPGKKKYDAQRLAHYLDVCHNNVLLFNTDNGQMRIYGSKGRFTAEITIEKQGNYETYHLTDPSIDDADPTIIGNIFMERFPVRKNRIVNIFMVAGAISKLYELQSLSDLIVALPFTDSTQETARLIERDAYIIPSVPLNIPKQKDYDRVSREKEERMQRALQELNGMKKDL